ncbi:MAG TPA: DUF3099 domain-containing protein [Pseudonocardia sp.]|jgi:hypothetical protein|nr:DUF3099 domain-containing protein [Pseudonocardia sp.]
MVLEVAFVKAEEPRDDQTAPQDQAPVLITDAAQSYEDEFKARRRRYSIMMSLRVPCLVLAAVFYQIPWLAAGLIIISIPLPWCAVLIANDRLPRKASVFRRHRGDGELNQSELNTIKQLESGHHQVIDPEN